MSELVFNPVFPDISLKFKDQAFSTMYFGRHCGKNLLILKHDLTVMVVFGDVLEWSSPELVKAVSFRGERKKGVEIVGNGNVILLLDEDGCLWRLINAFEVSAGEDECFHSLQEECFYEWIPFKKFNFAKVLAITAFEEGFACLGVCGNFQKKLLVLPSVDSPSEEYTFDELKTPQSNILNYYLTNLRISSMFEDALTSPSSETLLVADRISGKTYMCGKNRSSVINVSNDFLVSALHFQQEECVLLCFRNGKLVLCFYGESKRESVAYLSKKLIFVETCCCPDVCLLWSDGISLNHTKLTFKCDEDTVKLSHLQLCCSVQSPLSVVKLNQHVLAVTINNFYYSISVGAKCANEIRKHPQELLTEICKGSSLMEELEKKTDLLAHYLYCKEVMQKCKTKEKTEVKWEGQCLSIKSSLGISLREELWKVQLISSMIHKNIVRVVDLEADLSKEALIVIENPFKSKSSLKVRLIGDFDKKELFLDLGGISETEYTFEKDNLRKQIEKILNKKSKLHIRDIDLFSRKSLCKEEKAEKFSNSLTRNFYQCFLQWNVVYTKSSHPVKELTSEFKALQCLDNLAKPKLHKND